MKSLLPYLISALLGAAAFYFVRGCNNDAEVERRLKESRQYVDSLESLNDSIRSRASALRLGYDSLQSAAEDLDLEAEEAQRIAEAALTRLKEVKPRVSLSNDSLALYADSVFGAFAERHLR